MRAIPPAGNGFFSLQIAKKYLFSDLKVIATFPS